jgi:DivIVA domain-containing protein
MALTPEDVRNKQFTTVRFKEGYDLDEVDNFLDEIEESLLDDFVASGAQLKHTQAIIGPAICAKCYEVPTERVEQFRDVRPEAIASTTNLDLTAGVKSVLATQVSRTHEISGCTLESSELFSYRRAAGKPTGRGGLVIAISAS